MRNLVTLALFLLTFVSIAQRGKDGNYTVNTTGQVLNSYTYLTANATAGATSITVNNNSLNSGDYFTSNLAAGDLIFIIQLKGADIDGRLIDVGGGDSLGAPDIWGDNINFGVVDNYLNCGNYELADVTGVTGTNTISLKCGLENDYTASGKVQVVRVPRFQNLTVNGGASVVCPAWNNFTGGLVVLECEEDMQLDGSIDVSELGFRGGQTDNSSLLGGGQAGATNPAEGADKGEGIGGYEFEYSNFGGRYGKGAFANAGGGGTAHNAGGGGGANASTIAWNWGLGNPISGNANDVAAWNLEGTSSGNGMSSTTTSGGGGRGGYTFSGSNEDATTDAPGNTNWSGDNRRIEGGYGGRPLDYSLGKLFFGGGGGSGDGNDGDSSPGGRGGGLVFCQVYGSINGSGRIEANGQNGFDSDASNPPFGDIAGNDGAGGAGAGGTVQLNVNTGISAITINANGGNGGNQFMAAGAFGTIDEAFGPGGGGGGGYVSVSSAGATISVNGGLNGTTNSPDLSEFPANGATAGSSGLSANNSFFGIFADNDTLCGSGSTTLTATTVGTLPGGALIVWYSDEGSTVVGTGSTFTTPSLSSNTTYYVGFCPGGNLTQVEVIVQPGLVVDISNLVLNDENCGQNDGSITGISVSGGSGSYTYSWSNGGGSNVDATGLSAGSYTLTVDDGAGCMETSGPHIINTTAGPTIDISGLTISDETCAGSDGSITGITASGTSLSYDWNGNASAGTDLTGAVSGSYTLTVTDGNGCTATTGPHLIGSAGGPVIDDSNISISDENCGQGNGAISGITSSGTGTLSFQWNGSSNPSEDITGISGGSYTLTVTDGNGCSTSSGPYTVNNVAGPSINVSGISIVDEACGQSNGSITGIIVTGGTGAVSYEWNGSASTLDQTGLSANSYSLTATDAAGCVATAGPFAVNNLSGPSIDISNMVISDENCGNTDGSITGIIATGNGTLTYDWNGNTTASEDLTAQSTGSYTLTVTDGNGCTATSGPHLIGINNGPTIDDSGINITDESCLGNDGAITGITSTGSGTLSFDWNGNSSPSEDISNLSGGNYTLTVSDGFGCTTSSGPYTINTALPVTIDDSNISIIDESCGNSNGSITGITASGGNGALTYIWNTSPGNIDLTGASAGSYTLTVTDPSGCSATSGPYTINGTPPVTISVSGNTTICEGQSTTLTASGGTSYEWDNASTNSSETFQPSTTTTVQVIAFDGPCSDTADITITVNPLPVAAFTGDTVICEGQTASLTSTSSGNIEWSTLETSTNINVSPLITTQYYLIASNGCGDDTVFFSVDVNPLPTIDAGADETLNLGSSTSLNPSGGTAYLWSPPDGLSCTSCTNPVASPTETTTYYVVGTDANGCSSSDSVTINVENEEVLYIANVFSPNGDGQHDEFMVQGSGISEIELTIYDRWGQAIWQSNDMSIGWDGRNQDGKELNNGGFVYTVRGKFYSGKEINESGTVTLLR